MNTEEQMLAAGGQKPEAEPTEEWVRQKSELEMRLKELANKELAELRRPRMTFSIQDPEPRIIPPSLNLTDESLDKIRAMVHEEVRGGGHISEPKLKHLHDFLVKGKCPLCNKLQYETFLVACAMTNNALPVIPTHLCECRPETPQTHIPANHVSNSPHPKELQEKFLRMGYGAWVPTPGVEDEDREIYLTSNGQHIHVMSVEEALALSDEDLKQRMGEAVNAHQTAAQDEG